MKDICKTKKESKMRLKGGIMDEVDSFGIYGVYACLIVCECALTHSHKYNTSPNHHVDLARLKTKERTNGITFYLTTTAIVLIQY